MSEVTSSGLSAYQWTDYDKKINNKTSQQPALKEALSDNKLTGSEINDLKTKYQEAFLKENPGESATTAEDNFYEGLSSTTGIDKEKLKSANSSPVEFTFNLKNDKISTVVEDKNEDGDSEAATTKEGGTEAVITTSNDAKTPEGLKFKDYQTNNFNDAAKANGEGFAKGSVVTVKGDKVVAAVGGKPEVTEKENIQDFQRSIGLTDKDVDGKFGPKTLSALSDKYTEAINANPPTDASKAEVQRLGSAIDKLQPLFEGTKTGDDLKTLRAQASGSDKIDETKKGLTDRKEILKTAGDFVNKGSEALKSNPADYAAFKKINEDVKASNLPEPIKAKVLEQLGKAAETKLAQNIGSPPAKNLSGTELIDALPDNNASKIAFKAMYTPEVKDGKTSWTLKKPENMAEGLKGIPPEATAKVLSEMGPVDAGTIIKKMDPVQAKAAVDTMKPEDAAKILNKMTDKDAASVLIADGSDKSKTSAILSAMDPNKSKKILESTSKQFTAWTDAVKSQMTEDKAIKGLDTAITNQGTKYGTEFIDKITDKSSPKAQATKEGFTLLYDKTEKDGKAVWAPKAPPDKAKLAEFMQKPEFKLLSADTQKLISDQAKVEPKKEEVNPPSASTTTSDVQAPPPVKRTEYRPFSQPKPAFKFNVSHENPYTKTSDPEFFSSKVNKSDFRGAPKDYGEAGIRKAFEDYLRKQGKDPKNYDIKTAWVAPNDSFNVEAKLKPIGPQSQSI